VGWASWAAGKRGARWLLAAGQDHSEDWPSSSRNIGKPIGGARGEIIGVSLVFDYYAGAASRSTARHPVSKPGLDLTLREPIGVVGLIVPWNFRC
jgi:betaine-aldehyde dehydrogenase